MIEAIIIAGGEGRRLQSVVSDVPKPMAKVGGRPFLEYLVSQLKAAGVTRIVMSVSHKAHVIKDHFGDGSRFGVPMRCAEEKELLGTGGAICYAAKESNIADIFFVMNGDSYFDIDLKALARAHTASGAVGTLALRKFMNPYRSGVVEIDRNSRIVKFHEKKPVHGEALINGGVYVLSRSIFEHLPNKQKFSMEEEGFPAAIEAGLHGEVCEGYFIDIGIPEDFARAQEELPRHIKSEV